MGRKSVVWIFQAKNMRNFTREDWDMAKKGKPKKRNRISPHSRTKERQKDQLCQNDN